MVAGEITVAGKLHHETVVRGVAQRQAHMNRMVQKTMEIPQLRQTDQVIDVPVVLVVQVPWVRVVAEAAEIPQLPLVKKIGVIPEAAEIPQLLSDVRGVVQNIGIDLFSLDDLSSVGSKGLNHQDCEVLFHARMKRTMKCITQQRDSSQPINTTRERKKGEKGRRAEKEREKEDTVKGGRRGREERESVRKGERGKEGRKGG